MCFRPPSADKKFEPCPECDNMKDPIAVCASCGFVPEIECPKCGTKNLVTAEKCVQCGFSAPKAPPPPGMSGGRPPIPPPGQSGGAPTPPKAPPAPPKAPPAPPKKN